MIVFRIKSPAFFLHKSFSIVIELVIYKREKKSPEIKSIENKDV